MRRFALIALAAMAGCEGPPESRPLATGSEAIVYHAEKPTMLVGVPQGQGDYGLGIAHLPVGGKVVILDDPGGGPKRQVRVSVQDGRYQGITARIERRYLRPAPK
jgi:hypothetical protein